jgi:hypothetical protein
LVIATGAFEEIASLRLGLTTATGFLALVFLVNGTKLMVPFEPDTYLKVWPGSVFGSFTIWRSSTVNVVTRKNSHRKGSISSFFHRILIPLGKQAKKRANAKEAGRFHNCPMGTKTLICERSEPPLFAGQFTRFNGPRQGRRRHLAIPQFPQRLASVGEFNHGQITKGKLI